MSVIHKYRETIAKHLLNVTLIAVIASAVIFSMTSNPLVHSIVAVIVGILGLGCIIVVFFTQGTKGGK